MNAPSSMRCRSLGGTPALSAACIALSVVVARAAATNSLSPVLSASGSALPDTSGSIVRVLAALAFVLLVFGGILWALKNWQQLLIKRGAAPQLVITEARSLGNRSTVYVIKHQDRSFLIASSPQGVHFLADLGAPVPAAPVASDSDFEKALRQRTQEGA